MIETNSKRLIFQHFIQIFQLPLNSKNQFSLRVTFLKQTHLPNEKDLK